MEFRGCCHKKEKMKIVYRHRLSVSGVTTCIFPKQYILLCLFTLGIFLWVANSADKSITKCAGYCDWRMTDDFP